MNRPKVIGGVALSLALVAALVVSLLQGAGKTPGSGDPTPRAQKAFYGIIQGIRLDEQDFRTMAASGVGSDRFLILWGSVQPQQGSFNWGPTDTLVGAFASHGIRPAPFVWGSPPWVAASEAQPPLDTLQDVEAWANFLKAAVARYGPGGSYWADNYHQRYGEDAKPLPVESWQIWNEPNLKKYFAPGASPDKYARLLQISGSAIKSEDPDAKIILAGMPGYGDVTAWAYLDGLYSIDGIKGDFDALALHPYAPNVGQLRQEIERLREVMKDNGDEETPLWLTELGWGSGPPDRFGLNKGLAGQEKLLTGSFNLILSNRKAWNVQRVFWFDWRDPPSSGPVKCSFCDTAGLLRYDREPKPAYHAFKRFTTGD